LRKGGGFDLESAEGPRAAQRRGGKEYFGASVVAQFCALARYTLLARLLGPEQLGIAVALILTAQFFESVTDAGSDRFLVQDRHGDEPDVQRLAHLVWLGRGILIAAALVVLAAPIANFYGTPELAGGLALLALAPLIAGFAHLDHRRLQRASDFRSESRALLVSELASLAVTAIAAWITRDFTAILYGLITRSLLLAIVTHLTAERRYSIGYSAEHAGRIGRFGLPLMANGLLLFLGSQGDRVLIGNRLGLETLGYYSATLLLIMYPSAILMRFMTGMHMPLIAAAKDDPEREREAADRLAGQSLLLSIAMAAGFALVAPTVIVLLYGARFAQPALIVAAVGVLQTGRFLRLWPVTIALARGRSGIVLTSNLLRLAAFPLAYAATELGWGLLGILLAFTLAEFGSLILTSAILVRHSGLRLRDDLARVGAYVLASCLIVGWAAAVQYQILWLALALALPSLLLGFLVARSERAVTTEAWTAAKRFAGRR
jgi:O-antigen/teichoic acid export membrane protein